MPETGIDVAIMGAGIGGLWAALECWRKGHKVRIFEKTKAPDTHGNNTLSHVSAIFLANEMSVFPQATFSL